MESSIKVIIAEDHDDFRKQIVASLQDNDIEVIAEASNGKELLVQLENHIPDVILLDLNMPHLDGNKTMDELTKRYPQIKVIIFTSYTDEYLLEDYLLRGAKGYLTKGEAGGDTLAAGIKRVFEGGLVRSSNIVARRKKITARQIEIINLEAEEVPKKEIAESLNLTRDAVYKQEKAIKTKLGIKKGTLRTAINTLGLNFLGNRLNNLNGNK